MKTQLRQFFVVLAIISVELLTRQAYASGVVVTLDQPLLGSGPGRTVSRFGQSGDLLDEFSVPGVGTVFASTIAASGSVFYVGDFEQQHILKYSNIGASQGVFAALPPGVFGTTDILGSGTIETDVVGNVYAAKGGFSSRPRTSVRFDVNGNITQTFSHPSLVFPDGIDADANGNVYIINRGDVIYKFAPTGTFLGTLSIPEVDDGIDLAIDEANKVLYIADDFDDQFGVKAYNIGTASLTFSRRYATPSSARGLSYSDITHRLYVALTSPTVFGPTTGIELATDGTITNVYDPSTRQVMDLVFVIPEPASSILVVGTALICYAFRLRPNIEPSSTKLAATCKAGGLLHQAF